MKENLILFCFDGGVTIIYDVANLRVVQRIVEYGIYSIEQYTMNNALDVDFTQDGSSVAFTSNYGTLSLYSLNHFREAQYKATRVQ